MNIEWRDKMPRTVSVSRPGSIGSQPETVGHIVFDNVALVYPDKIIRTKAYIAPTWTCHPCGANPPDLEALAPKILEQLSIQDRVHGDIDEVTWKQVSDVPPFLSPLA